MPAGRRRYLPHGLTKTEKRSKKIQRKLSSCIRQVEQKCCTARAKRSNGTYDYKKCKCNPVAICRASISGKTHKMNERQVTRAWARGKISARRYHKELGRIATSRHAKEMSKKKDKSSMSSSKWR